MSGTPSSDAGLLVDRDNRDDEAVLGEMPAVAQHLVADFAGAGVVDEDAADGRLAANPPAGVVELHEVAVLGEDDLGLRLASGEDARRDPRVLRQLAVLAVHRDEEARPHQRQHQLQLFFAAVSRHVHVLDPLVDHVGAAPREVVHHAADRLLVAGNRARREHDRVVGADLDVAVIVDRDARQRRHRLALRAGRQAQDVLRRVGADVASRESARRAGCAGSRAAGRSRSCASCRARRTRPCDRTAPRDPRGSASGRCSTRTPRRSACRSRW